MIKIDEDEIKAKIAKYKFYHIIKITDNIYTPGFDGFRPFQNMALEALKKIDLKGKRVLDIGCRDGLFSFAAEKMGASEVIGIDNDISRPAVEFLIPFFESKVKMYQMNLYDLSVNSFGYFDVVIFAGVLYHLRYPFWGLKIIRDVLNDNGKLFIETGMWRSSMPHAMLYCPTGREAIYDISTVTFFNEKGIKNTLSSLGFEMESLEYLDKRPRRQNMVIKFKKIIKYLLNKETDFIQSVDTDRAVIICNLLRERQNVFLKKYWDELHENHSVNG